MPGLPNSGWNLHFSAHCRRGERNFSPNPASKILAMGIILGGFDYVSSSQPRAQGPNRDLGESPLQDLPLPPHPPPSSSESGRSGSDRDRPKKESLSANKRSVRQVASTSVDDIGNVEN